jgi:hypothetical protein
MKIGLDSKRASLGKMTRAQSNAEVTYHSQLLSAAQESNLVDSVWPVACAKTPRTHSSW